MRVSDDVHESTHTMCQCDDSGQTKAEKFNARKTQTSSAMNASLDCPSTRSSWLETEPTSHVVSLCGSEEEGSQFLHYLTQTRITRTQLSFTHIAEGTQVGERTHRSAKSWFSLVVSRSHFGVYTAYGWPPPCWAASSTSGGPTEEAPLLGWLPGTPSPSPIGTCCISGVPVCAAYNAAFAAPGYGDPVM